jgi:hypothetical protein
MRFPVAVTLVVEEFMVVVTEGIMEMVRVQIVEDRYQMDNLISTRM